MKSLDRLQQLQNAGAIPQEYCQHARQFIKTYLQAIQNRDLSAEDHEEILIQFVDLIAEAVTEPYSFEPYHEAMRDPLDYYRYGLDLFRPLIVFDQSSIGPKERIETIEEQLKKKENVILLANHQIEPDPQVLSLMLEKDHPELAEKMIFVAGQRVITDPMAIPFSKGRNLLCIFSKKYIENPPEQKDEKMLHNQRTMRRMGQLLAEGGHCIYVAPSGGRDRPNAQGIVEVAAFDPDSIEMFWLMAHQAKRTTHFYPLALNTYDLLPPPQSTEVALGEQRHTQCTPVHVAFGPEIDMEHFPGSEGLDRKSRRPIRAFHIWQLVKQAYDAFPKQGLN